MTTGTKTSWAALVAAGLALAPAAASRAQSTLKPEPLSDRSRAAIEEALQDELRGEAFYARVLKDHGDVRPFSNVVRAERRHADFLAELLKARGLAVPERRPATAEPPAHASVKEACAAAVEFETENVALYDRLIAAGPLPDDVKRAFDHNRMASLDHHKPAFERCAGLATGHGAGRSVGRGHGCHGHGCGHCGQECEACGPGCGSCGRGCGHGAHGCGHGGHRGGQL
jgi:rubrerythrin